MADLEPPPGPADPAEASISFGSFHLHPARQLLLDGDRPIAIGGRAFDLLLALVDRAGEVVTKEELVDRAWPGISVDESNLRAQVAALRRALGDGRNGVRLVATVPGRGYRFVAPVSPADRAREPVDVGASRRALPARLTQPIGRADVVRAIGNQLTRRRLVTIVGAGGIGKTTAALAVAEALLAAYEDGVCFVDLTPLADARHVPGALASALGLSIAPDDPTPAVVAFLRERRVLLIFDGCEHFVAAVAVLAEQVLRGAPDARVLATSREPLRADGESVHRLAPLEVPPAQASIAAADARTFSAVELFVERAASCIDGFELSDADAPIVAEICRRLDGLPLAIELVARRIDAFGVRGLADHLDDRFRLLSRGLTTAPPRQRTLQATLDWSWECLPEDERAMLSRLAIFAGSFTLEMASAIVGDAGGTDAVDGVASLVARSLVAAELGGAAALYRLLDTTRAYALARLVASGEYDRIARRHAENLVAVMERASGEWGEARHLSEWTSHGRQIDNLRRALDWAFSPGGDASIGVRLTIAAIPLWLQLPLIEECFSRVQQALESVGSGPSRDPDARHATQLLEALGRALATGFAPEATAAFARALEIAEGFGDTENRLGMLFGLWTCRFLGGEHRAALDLAQRFCKLAETAPEPADRFIGDRLLGISLHYLGDQAQARRHLERMLDGYVAPTSHAPTIRYQSDQRVLARAMLARVLWLQGLPAQAVRAARRTVEDARATGHPIWVVSALTLAECPIALLVGDLATAERSVDSLRDHFTRYRLGPWAGRGRCFEGVVRVARGDVEHGLDLLRAGISEASGSGNLRVDLLLLASMAEALGRNGASSEGLATVDEALERSERLDERWCMPELLRVKGELLLRDAGRRSPQRAEACFQRGLDAARRAGALAWELRCATSLAHLWREAGRRGDARELLASVHGRFSEGFETADLRAARRLIDALS